MELYRSIGSSSVCDFDLKSLLNHWAAAAFASLQLWLCRGSAPSTRERQRASGRWEKATVWVEQPGLTSKWRLRSNPPSRSISEKTRDTSITRVTSSVFLQCTVHYIVTSFVICLYTYTLRIETYDCPVCYSLDNLDHTVKGKLFHEDDTVAFILNVISEQISRCGQTVDCFSTSCKSRFIDLCHRNGKSMKRKRKKKQKTRTPRCSSFVSNKTS